MKTVLFIIALTLPLKENPKLRFVETGSEHNLSVTPFYPFILAIKRLVKFKISISIYFFETKITKDFKKGQSIYSS